MNTWIKMILTFPPHSRVIVNLFLNLSSVVSCNIQIIIRLGRDIRGLYSRGWRKSFILENSKRVKQNRQSRSNLSCCECFLSVFSEQFFLYKKNWNIGCIGWRKREINMRDQRFFFKLSYCYEYTLTLGYSGFWQDSGHSTDLDRLGLS